jgi:hypothetical protein
MLSKSCSNQDIYTFFTIFDMFFTGIHDTLILGIQIWVPLIGIPTVSFQFRI